MKRIYIIILLIITSFSELYSQQYWLNMGKVADQHLWKCSFTDSLNGWAVGDSGLIIHTSNGGANWIVQDSKSRELMQTVFFLNKRLGWAVAWSMNSYFYGTVLLRTTDGGTNWDTSTFSIADSYVRSVYFQDSLHGFMGGGAAILLRTTNAGANWIQCGIDSNQMASRFPIHGFKFYNQNYGVAHGGIMDVAGVIWTTTNRGIYWSTAVVAAEPLVGVKFYDSLNIFALGGDYEYGASIVRTTDGGQNWIYKNLGIFGTPFNLSFRTESEGWASMGYLPKFFVTLDSGLSWNEFETPDTVRIFHVQFLTDKIGYAVGTNGTFIKFNSALININGNNTLTEKYILKQNYPNPFNPVTNIEYDISDISEADLRVYDILGKEKAVIYKGIRAPGKYTERFYGNNLPSGVYFYILKIKDIKTGNFFSTTKKMVLIK